MFIMFLSMQNGGKWENSRIMQQVFTWQKSQFHETEKDPAKS